MKHVTKNLVIVGAMLAAGSTAAMIEDVKPYVGIDYYHAWMKGAKSTSKPDNVTFDLTKETPKSYPGVGAYIGAKFTECFGIELGANWGRQKKTTVISDPDKLKVEVKRRGMHADLVGSIPLNDCFDILGFVGVGWVKPKTTLTYIEGDTVIVAETLKNKSTPVARLGVGASYMVTDVLGLRAKLGWENTRRLKLQETVAPIQTYKPFKDTMSLSLGAFARW